jgi:hypothetical protein
MTYTPRGILIAEVRRLTVCREVTCRKCGKATWAGCGQHVDQVMRGIPKNQRCQGHEAEPGFFAKLFGGKK